jgi:hypothetical protein
LASPHDSTVEGAVEVGLQNVAKRVSPLAVLENPSSFWPIEPINRNISMGVFLCAELKSIVALETAGVHAAAVGV